MTKNIISVAVLTAFITSFNGCGDSNSDSSSKIDLAEYFEKESRVNNIVRIEEHSKYPEPNVIHYTDTVVVNDNLITHEIFGQRSFSIDINETDLNITYIPNNITYAVTRHITLGEEVSSYSIDQTISQNGINVHMNQVQKCVITDKTNSFTVESVDDNLTYEGDIIVQVCTSIGKETYLDLNESFTYTDIYHEYYQKDKGRIAVVNKNCLVPHQNTNPDNNETYYDVDDNSDECAITITRKELLLE